MCARPDIAHAVSVVSRFLSNLAKTIGKWLSGFLGISGVPPKCFYALEVRSVCWKVSEMQTWHEISTLGSPYQDTYLNL